jgi:hypothetical protein
MIVLAMAFALVSISEAGLFPFNYSTNDNTPAVASDVHPLCWAGYCPDMKLYLERENRDRDSGKPPLVTPEPMGSLGL